MLNDSDGMQQRSQQGSVAQHQHCQDERLDDGRLKQEVDFRLGGMLSITSRFTRLVVSVTHTHTRCGLSKML